MNLKCTEFDASILQLKHVLRNYLILTLKVIFPPQPSVQFFLNLILKFNR
jgi:hypothetical protein